MAKLLTKSMSSSSLLYSHSLDRSASRGSRRTAYGRQGPDGTFDSATTPLFVVRIPRKLRILKLDSRRVSDKGEYINNGQGLDAAGEYINNGQGLDAPGQQAVEQPSRTVLRRMRVAYESWMVKAGSASGEFTAIPVAKTSRAPAALTSVVSTWIAPPSSEKGTKIADLDPGFKLTAAERKYLEHLKRTAASRGF